jgi:hypothetical protein
MTKRPEPTERDNYWLAHESALAASGKTAKAYADDHELSLHAFYQARKRLRALGFLPAVGSRRGSRQASRKSVSFSKVELTPPPRTRAEFRLGLPNGLTLEWSGSELPAPVVELLERLIQSR